VLKTALPRRTDRQRGGEQKRAFHCAELRELREPGGLAVAVDDVAGAEHLLGVEIPVMREDRRDAGSQPVALGKRAMPDQHARHVDERVAPAGRKAADGVAQVAQALSHGGQHTKPAQ
jgi:hypothetical protein